MVLLTFSVQMTGCAMYKKTWYPMIPPEPSTQSVKKHKSKKERQQSAKMAATWKKSLAQEEAGEKPKAKVPQKVPPQKTVTVAKATAPVKPIFAPKPTLPKETPLPKVESSTILVPVSVPLNEILDLGQLEARIPKSEDYNEDWKPFPTPESAMALKFKWDRDDFTYSATRNQAMFQTMMHYQFAYAEKRNRSYPPFTCCVWDTRSACGPDKPGPTMDVKVNSEISLGSDWNLISQTQIVADNSQGCDQNNINRPLIDKVQDRLTSKLNHFVSHMDKKTASYVNLKPQAQVVWSALKQSISIDKKNRMWLTFRPSKIRISPVELDAFTANFTIGIEAAPRIIQGRKPSVKKKALPEILLGKPEPGFQVVARAVFSHKSATGDLQEKLAGKVFHFARSRKVEVENVRVYGNSLKAIVELEVKGAFAGKIYMSGRPQYEQQKGRLFIPDLDFDLKTRDWLTNKAKWLVSNKFVNALRLETQWNVSQEMEAALEDLKKGINQEYSPNVRFAGIIKNFNYLGINSTRSAFLIISLAEGNLNFLTNNIPWKRAVSPNNVAQPLSEEPQKTIMSPGNG